LFGMISNWDSSMRSHTYTKTRCLDGRFGAGELSTESVAPQRKGGTKTISN